MMKTMKRWFKDIWHDPYHFLRADSVFEEKQIIDDAWNQYNYCSNISNPS